jgi:hypothetical protein
MSLSNMLNMFKAPYDMVAVLLMFQVELLMLSDCDAAYPPVNEISLSLPQ